MGCPCGRLRTWSPLLTRQHPPVTGDAAELAEVLQFLRQWSGRDPGRLGASLEGFAGTATAPR